ncbi:MAG TPA: hypothetical protein VE174_02225 [Actinomycetota bacterium]|nr:hypothetical protein [Actinomycetota bacterium]
MTEEEFEALEKQAKEDRKLLQKAERVLAEIDRASGLSNEQADVLAALRIRIEGKPRGSLEDLLSVAGDISGKRDLGAALDDAEAKPTTPDSWPEVKETKKDWPSL